MRSMLLILVMLGSTAAQAQPGQTMPVDPSQPTGLAPQPQYYAQPQVVQLQLTADQMELLEKDEISVGKYVTGGILSYVLGFGVGQAIQGRWSDDGWFFTVGEAAAVTSMIYGASRCCQHQRGQGYILGGALAFVGLRVWEVVDAWVVPPLHNRKVRALKRQLGLAPPPSRYGLYLAPPQAPDGSGGVAGLALSF